MQDRAIVKSALIIGVTAAAICLKNAELLWWYLLLILL